MSHLRCNPFDPLFVGEVNAHLTRFLPSILVRGVAFDMLEIDDLALPGPQAAEQLLKVVPRSRHEGFRDD